MCEERERKTSALTLCFRENAFHLIHVIWQQSPFLFSLCSFSCQSSLWDILSSAILRGIVTARHFLSLVRTVFFRAFGFYITGSIDLYVFALLFLILHSCHRTLCMFLFAILGPCVSVCVTWHCPGMSCLFMFYRSYSNTYVSSWEPHLKSLKNYPHTLNRVVP